MNVSELSHPEGSHPARDSSSESRVAAEEYEQIHPPPAYKAKHYSAHNDALKRRDVSLAELAPVSTGHLVITMEA